MIGSPFLHVLEKISVASLGFLEPCSAALDLEFQVMPKAGVLDRDCSLRSIDHEVAELGAYQRTTRFGIVDGYFSDNMIVLPTQWDLRPLRIIGGQDRGFPCLLHPRGVLICPGPVHTPLWDNASKIIDPDDPQGMMDAFATANIPLGRFGRVDEVASLVTFLASERASFITGAAYDIDGGMVKYMM